MDNPKTPRTFLPIILILLAISLVTAIDKANADYSNNPVIKITSLTPNPASPGQQVRLNFTASDNQGVITTTWVNWGDGSTPDLTFNVTTGSMCQRLTNPSTNQCTLAIGSLTVIKPQDPSTIIPTCANGNYACTSPPTGTIILFRPPYPFSSDPNYLVVHRVVAEQQNSQGYYFYTRGDANGGACNCYTANDPWDGYGGLPATNIVGVYQYTLPPMQGGPTARFFTHTYSGSGNSTPKTYAISINCTSVSTTASTTATAYTTETVEPLQSSNISTIMGLTPAVFFSVIGVIALATITIALLILRSRPTRPL